MLKNVRVRFFYSLFSRIQSKYGKIRTKKNRYSNIFQAAKTLKKKQFAMFFLFDQILHKNKPSKTAI